jgi:arsenite transporter
MLIAVGLILMMYPPLAKVKYEEMPRVFKNTKILTLSLIQNWIIGPILMFALALIFLHGHPEYMVGLILVGIARCIAMVLVWNELAKGNSEYCAGLVASTAWRRSCFTAPTPGCSSRCCRRSSDLKATVLEDQHDGHLQQRDDLSRHPVRGGILSRVVLMRLKGRDWYDHVFIPKISPITLTRCCSPSS